MSDVTLSYKGSDILELSDSGSATLKTGGTYCEADIEVEYVKPSGGGGDYTADDIADININGVIEISKTVKDYAFYSAPITKLTGTTERINQYSFQKCTSLEEIDLPMLTRLSTGSFRECTKLKTLKVPALQILGNSTFSGCKALERVALPSLSQQIANTPFQNCSSLVAMDIGNANSTKVSINWTGLGYMPACTTLVLRREPSITPMTHTGGLIGTPFASDGTGGTIYIPKTLYDHLGDGSALDYKSATNWSTYDGYGNITWAQIEGSYYETHYADGTVIS